MMHAHTSIPYFSGCKQHSGRSCCMLLQTQSTQQAKVLTGVCVPVFDLLQ